MITPKLKKSVWVVLAAAALTACGGGGGSSSGSDTPAPEPTPTPSPEPEPTPTPVADVTYADIDPKFAKYDETINKFICFRGENEDKCKRIIYQVMVEAAPNGGEKTADGKKVGKGTGWGPSDHMGTLGGIANSLDFIKGSGANALWITPVFTTSKGFGDEKTNATGYFASEYWNNNNGKDEPSIDPDFGGLESFKRLVSETHNTFDDVDGKGMWFILDGVFGHARYGFNSTLAGYTPVTSDDCLTKSGEKKSKKDKEVYGSAGSNFTCFDWDNDQTRAFFYKLASKMISEYRIDGWRLDQAYQVPHKYWGSLKQDVKQASTDAGLPGYMVAEIMGSASDIEKTVFKEAAVESAFNFPLRYKLLQVVAGQEDPFNGEETGREALFIADEYGYGSFAKYSSYDVMPNMFTDNHDLVRFGNLLFRNNILDINSAEPLLKNDVGVPEYSLRHLLAFAFMMEYSGPITIYYGSEYGDWTEGFSKKLDPCGTGEKWCDDHVSRTQMKSSEDDLKQWQKDLRTNVRRMMTYRKEHPALYNGNRFHIYSTDTEKPSRDDANFYVDVKKAADGEAFVFVASMSRKDRTLQFEEGPTKGLCQKAKGADSCELELVMDTSKPEVMSTDSVRLNGSTFAFEMPALSARLYIVK